MRLLITFSLILLIACCGEHKNEERTPLSFENYTHNFWTKMDSVRQLLGAVDNLDLALERAHSEKKPILLFFSAIGCQNCRKFEYNQLLGNKKILDTVKNNFITAWLFVDDRTKIENPHNPRERVGDQFCFLQTWLTQTGSQPIFLILSPTGDIISKTQSYTKDPDEFLGFLEHRIPSQPGIDTKMLSKLGLKLRSFAYLHTFSYPHNPRPKDLGSRVDSSFCKRYFKFDGTSHFPCDGEHYYYAWGKKIGKFQPVVVKVFWDNCYEPLMMILVNEEGEFVNSFPVGVWSDGCEGSKGITTRFDSDSTFSQTVENCETTFAEDEHIQDNTACNGTKGRFHITSLGKIDTLEITHF